MENIKEYDLYSITENGEIFSHLRNKWLKHYIRKDGYHQVQLRKDGKTILKLPHRLVAQVYLGESDLTVNHIDGNKSNNHVSNLEWVTHQENQLHAFRLGLRDNSGEKHPRMKLTDVDVIDIRNSKLNQTQIAKQYNMSRGHINRIINHHIR